ncbi:MAG TPA: nucleotide exchange factor GrpE [Pseudolabrys sp.]|jgi:molecular chaperone GrpE|nr:nucleotide exchange factor GrpE [Pseudolabrys sp.]
MTDPTARKAEAAAAEAQAKVDAEAAAAEADPQARSTEKTAEQSADPVAEAKKEAADYRDKLLRTLAEMENLRKRTEREIGDARAYGITGFARDVLSVADNMHRALEAVDPSLRESADAKVKSLVEGVEMTERELLKALEKHGVKKFSPEGQKFDPNVHQAMFEMENPDVPPGHVAQVMQAGYMIGERVLRPAMVGVSKAAPKPAAASANDNSGAN